MGPKTRYALLVLLAATFAGCSGVQQSAVADRPNEVETIPEVTEPFDISSFEDQSATIEPEWEHDVPASLMENRADAGARRTVDGFRVQVFSSLELDEATSAEERARQAWPYVADRVGLTDPDAEPIQVYRFFRQPYYRIRVGDFASRADASRYAAIYAEMFAGAMVVPDRVTVRK